MNPLNRGRCGRCVRSTVVGVNDLSTHKVRILLYCEVNKTLCQKCASKCKCPPMGIEIKKIQ